MAVSCDPNDLAYLARCFYGMSDRVQKGVQLIQLCGWINGTTFDCDPNVLAEQAKCFTGSLSDHQIDAIIVYLWCQIANDGGGTSAITLRYANFFYAEFPALAPVFVESDFTGGNADVVDLVTDSPFSRVGTITFPDRAARQIAWYADSLGAPAFTVDGDSWILDPDVDTAVQNLTVEGVDGKVFLTAWRNPGGYTVDVA